MTRTWQMNTRFLLPCYNSWQEWLVSLFHHSLFWSFSRIALSRLTQQQGSSRSTNCCSFIQDDFLKIFSCQPKVGIVLGWGLFVLSSCWNGCIVKVLEMVIPCLCHFLVDERGIFHPPRLSLLLDHCNFSIGALRLFHRAVFARWECHGVRMKSL